MHAYKGNQPFFSYPRVLGHELVGTIEQIGEDVTGLQVGDQVSIIPYLHCGVCIACRNDKTNCCTDMKVLGIDDGMRELIALPVSHLIKTDGLTLDQAAMLEPLSIGAYAVRRSELRTGETALVIGAGPIGLGVMILAKTGANPDEQSQCHGGGFRHGACRLTKRKHRHRPLHHAPCPIRGHDRPVRDLAEAGVEGYKSNRQSVNLKGVFSLLFRAESAFFALLGSDTQTLGWRSILGAFQFGNKSSGRCG
ncbi:Alcohol dehydrogenase GroES-like domain-containing protein [Paenibacillus sp. yr247]|nr:Alcohol dehydrogenase GroES-like domain-containing protein [Paenibacillus sp. yr247]